MHLVGFIIRIYHDARSCECQSFNPLYLLLRLGCKSGVGISAEQVLKADHFINSSYSIFILTLQQSMSVCRQSVKRIRLKP
jgi:hypothetical protein